MKRHVFWLISLCTITLLSGCGGSSSKAGGDSTGKENNIPVAHIQLDQSSITRHGSVKISGEKSNDADGDALSYQWKIQDEAGLDYLLADNKAKTIVFTPEKSGTYKATLVVNDSKANSKMVSTTIQVTPKEEDFPSAVAKGPINNKVGAINRFTAEKSLPTSGQELSYSWTIKTKPEASNSTISDEKNMKAFLITDKAGDYEIMLTVTNSENQLIAVDVFTLKIDEVLSNSAPVAVINTAWLTYALNSAVSFEGSASYDHDQNKLDYLWSIEKKPAASQTLLTNNTKEDINLTLDIEGEYHIKLTVTDGQLSHGEVKIITVTSENIKPIANAGEDQVTGLQAQIILDASASSDAEKKILTYQWRLINKPATSNYNELNESAFIADNSFVFQPDVIGNYSFSLQVFDGVDYSVLDQVLIQVTDNQRPVAKLSGDIQVDNSNRQTIRSIDSYDPEGEKLTYLWTLINAPDGFNGKLNSSATNRSNYTYLSTTSGGTYTVQLIVNDGIQNSLPATINIVRAAVNWQEVMVSGKFVDHGKLPLAGLKVSSILEAPVYTDIDGNFEIRLKRNVDTLRRFSIGFSNEGISTDTVYFDHDNEQPIDYGELVFPVLQKKHITVNACDSYTGTQKVSIVFKWQGLTQNGLPYRFLNSYKLTINAAPVELRLPAQGEIAVRVSGKAVSIGAGESYFIHNYQADDSGNDPLNITLCD